MEFFSFSCGTRICTSGVLIHLCHQQMFTVIPHWRYHGKQDCEKRTYLNFCIK